MINLFILNKKYSKVVIFNKLFTSYLFLLNKYLFIYLFLFSFTKNYSKLVGLER